MNKYTITVGYLARRPVGLDTLRYGRHPDTGGDLILETAVGRVTLGTDAPSALHAVQVVGLCQVHTAPAPPPAHLLQVTPAHLAHTLELPLQQRLLDPGLGEQGPRGVQGPGGGPEVEDAASLCAGDLGAVRSVELHAGERDSQGQVVESPGAARHRSDRAPGSQAGQLLVEGVQQEGQELLAI